MKNIYLDHNVYIQASVDNTLYNFLLHLKNDINIKFLYSPAHIEEIYKVKSNEDLSAADAALKRADSAEKIALQTLKMN